MQTEGVTTKHTADLNNWNFKAKYKLKTALSYLKIVTNSFIKCNQLKKI